MNKERPCGKCAGCQKVENEQHPDIFFLAPENDSIKIDHARQLSSQLQYHPIEARAKIAIIDDAHTMTVSAANSLLKILEEPPTKTHFIFITPSPSLLLATIRSRCRIISFSPLPLNDIARYLTTQEAISADEAKTMASLSQGSLGLAMELDRDVIEEVSSRWDHLMANKTAVEVLALSEEWAKKEEKMPIILEILMSRYRDRLIDAPSEKLDQAFRATVTTLKGLMTTVNKQLLFEELLFTLIRCES
ncbi:MAG: DNA polymerase III subunit delta' [Deltaproteobacteria bacterium]|nr:DNA polymerase III subunit delta' [Deltaproteobacteria bacterium]